MPVALALLWLVMVGVFELLRPALRLDLTLCMFRNVTGVPCPTCGTTRMLLALARGQPVDALLFNPFTFAVSMLGAIWLILRLGFGRRLSLDLGRAARRRVWIVVTILFLFNWAYLIWREFA